MLVLLVEDDMDLAELVIEYLESESFTCDVAYNGAMALGLIEKNAYAMIITDIMMPKMDGFEFCETLRSKGNQTPLLMLTARDHLEDKLKGFNLGADDYLVKPFELAELVARIKIRAVSKTNQGSMITVGTLCLNKSNQQATRDGTPIKLGPNDIKLLEQLMLNSPNIVTKSQIEEHIWQGELPTADAYKMLIYRLRKAIDIEYDAPYITTIRGQGVQLIAPKGKDSE